MNADLLMLKIRALIAQQEMIVAQANRDLQTEAWLCDYRAAHDDIGVKIEQLVDELEANEGAPTS